MEAFPSGGNLGLYPLKTIYLPKNEFNKLTTEEGKVFTAICDTQLLACLQPALRIVHKQTTKQFVRLFGRCMPLKDHTYQPGRA